MSVFNVTDFTDNACINIYPIGGDFVAASETDAVLSFDPETLETKDRVSGRSSDNSNYYDEHSGLYVHTAKTMPQDCLLPKLVVSEPDPQWSCTKTTVLIAVLALLQPNVFIIML